MAADDVASTLAAIAGVAGEFVAGTEWSGVEWSEVEWSGVEWSGIIQRQVHVHLWPQTIVQPQYPMEHPILVKVTVQPTLHIVTMDRRECNARPGMM